MAGIPLQPSQSTGSAEFNALSMAMLVQELALLPKVMGGSPSGAEEEQVNEWLKRLKKVASLCEWNEQAKLVNVITHLQARASRLVLPLVYPTSEVQLLGIDGTTNKEVHTSAPQNHAK